MVAVAAGGIGAGGVISACTTAAGKSWHPVPNGTECKPNQQLLTWNVAGPQGVPGVSPTVAQIDLADAVDAAHCPTGGAKITDAASHVAYVCNGAAGAPGADGAPGMDGQPFSGTFTSPSGDYSITVSDSGITLQGPSSTSIAVTSAGITLLSGGAMTLKSATNLDLTATHGAASLEAGVTTSVAGGLLKLNGGCLPVARTTDPVSGSQVLAGSATVLSC